MLARWWGVLRITRAHSTALCEKLCFHPSFAQDLQALDTFAQSPPPQNGTQLKIRLAAADFKDEREAIAAVAAMGKEFAAVLPLHEALLACGEPYRTAQLAIGKAALCTMDADFRLKTEIENQPKVIGLFKVEGGKGNE